METKKMTMAQKQALAKQNVVDLFNDILKDNDAVVVGANTYAIETEVDGKAVWVTVNFVAKKDGYDAITENEEYEADLEIKKAEKEAKEKAKAEKKAKVNAKKVKAE